MAPGSRVARFLLGVAVVLGLALWVVALLMFGESAERSDDFANNATAILLINAVGVVVLFWLIGSRLLRLIRDYRRFVPGSRLMARVVGLVVIVAAVPLTVLYIFAVLFIAKGIDEWFPVDIDTLVRGSAELANTAVEIRQQDNLDELARLAERLALAPEDIERRLAAIWQETGALEVALYGADGRRLAVHPDGGGSMPLRFDESARLALPGLETEGRSAYLVPQGDGSSYAVSATVVFAPSAGAERILRATFALPVPIRERYSAVEDIQGDLLLLQAIRVDLERTFTLVLSMVLLVAILGAVYASVFVAERLISPLQQLMQGTRAVARGDFDTRVELRQRDEIGFLVDSFNNMTQRLALARQEARDSEHKLEEERRKLEVILAGLSSGVISIEPDFTIRAANRSASEILGVDLEAAVGQSLATLAETRPQLRQFLSACARHQEQGNAEWREQITLRGDFGNRELVCACAELPAEGEEAGAYVIVFDDITMLMQAQREAAWGEVARRLAHEIKNPLTPIQLSAERVRRRFLVDGNEDLDLLDRATHTIIQQVDSMKSMVDAFSEYARAPDLSIATIDLNALVGEVTELYRHQASPVRINMNLDTAMPAIDADIGRLRQVMHNLMRNASEAIEGQADACIEVTTRHRELPDGPYAEIVVSDNGPGFAAEIAERAFQPYVTSKAKGTGLGLAIVRKLVEEHGGTIRAGNREQRGAEVSILLPVSGAGRGAGASRRMQQRRKRA